MIPDTPELSVYIVRQDTEQKRIACIAAMPDKGSLKGLKSSGGY